MNHPKLWVGAAFAFTALVAVASALLPRGLTLEAVSDIVGAVLMLFALISFAPTWARRAKAACAGSGCCRRADGLCGLRPVGWIVFDLVFSEKFRRCIPRTPLFLAGAPMFAGLFFGRTATSERSARLGILDFALLSMWWLYLYLSYVICWQYVSPNEAAYNRNFDLLSGAESVLLQACCCVLAREFGTMEDLLCLFLRSGRLQRNLSTFSIEPSSGRLFHRQLV